MKVDISVAFIMARELPTEAVAELIVYGDLREVSGSESKATGTLLRAGEHAYRFTRLASDSSVKLAIAQMLFSLSTVLADHGVLGEDEDVMVDRVFANVVQR